ERHLVGLGIKDRHVVGGIFVRAVERAVRIDRRIAPVGRDQIVQIILLGAPLPRCDDEVALDALWARRLALGEFALGDALGPVAEVVIRRGAELAGKALRHLLARLAGLGAAHPGLTAVTERAERRRDCARRLLANLVAANAVDVVHLAQPVLPGDAGGD